VKRGDARLQEQQNGEELKGGENRSGKCRFCRLLWVGANRFKCGCELMGMNEVTEMEMKAGVGVEPAFPYEPKRLDGSGRGRGGS